MRKAHNMQEQMSNVSKEMKILKVKMLQIKNTNKWRMPLIGLVDTTKERISEFEDMPVETSQTEKQREKRNKKPRISRDNSCK